MTTRLLVDMPALPEPVAALRSLPNLEVDCMETPAEEFRELPAERLQGVHALFCTRPPSNFADLKSLRWIQLSSTGYSQIFGLDLAHRGIRVTNARGCFDVPIAEWTISMMVNLARRVPRMLQNQERGIWDRDGMFQHELRGSIVGFWGYGGIGRETARIAKTMGLTVHVLARRGVGPRGLVFRLPGTGDPDGTLPDRVFLDGQEEEFLQELDFLVLALPLTRSTEGLIGERELRWLPENAFLLNPSRGPIVQREPLLTALREGWIAGAALDTHYTYPTPPDDPFWRLPNVIFTPHIAGSTLNPSYLKRIWEIQVENTRRFLSDQPLLNQLTQEQLNGD